MKTQITMPPYVVQRPRKHHTVYYYVVPKRLRPDDWPASIRLGTDVDHGLTAIHDYAADLYDQYCRMVKKKPPKNEIRQGTVLHIIRTYLDSDDHRNLRAETQKSYGHLIDKIKAWAQGMGNPDMRNITAPVLYKFLSQLSDRPRQQQYYRAIWRVLFKIAVRHGYVERNIVKDIELPKQRKEKKRLVIWEEADVEHIVKTADALGYFNVGTAVMIGFYTGQRQTDVFRYCEPRDYSDGYFHTYASKTGAIINMHADTKLIERLNQRPAGQLMLTVNDRTGRPWTKDAFENQFSKIRDKAGMKGYVFRQLRNSAAMHAEAADLTDAEFESVFGWPRHQVRTMLSQHYSDRNQRAAESGIAKLHDYRQKQRRSRTD